METDNNVINRYNSTFTGEFAMVRQSETHGYGIRTLKRPLCYRLILFRSFCNQKTEERNNNLFYTWVLFPRSNRKGSSSALCLGFEIQQAYGLFFTT